MEITRSTGALGAQAAAALRKTAYDVEADTKSTIVSMDAVDTGNMMNSVSTDFQGTGSFGSMTAEIGPTVDYALYVHDGTSRVAPRPFMDAPFTRNSEKLVQAFEQIAGDFL